MSWSLRRGGGTTSSSPEAPWNLFRSEEHVARWLERREPGATLPVARLCDLAHAWYGDRLAPDRARATAAESQAILDGLDLTGSVLQLT